MTAKELKGEMILDICRWQNGNIPSKIYHEKTIKDFCIQLINEYTEWMDGDGKLFIPEVRAEKFLKENLNI